MASWLRRLGGVLVVLALAMVAVRIPLQAPAADKDDFDQLVGWANILALSLGAIGIGLWLFDRWVPKAGATLQQADVSLDELAVHVLEQESRQRAALLGIDSPSTIAANIRYDRLIQFQQADGGPGGDLTGVGDFYLEQTGGRMVILGSPGAGKSVLALELLVQLLERRRRCTDPAARAAIRPSPAVASRGRSSSPAACAGRDPGRPEGGLGQRPGTRPARRGGKACGACRPRWRRADHGLAGA